MITGKSLDEKNLEQQLVEAEEKVKELRKQLFEKNIRPIDRITRT